MPSKGDYIIIGVGALAAVLISSYVPSLVKATALSTMSMGLPVTNEISQEISMRQNILWQTETGY